MIIFSDKLFQNPVQTISAFNQAEIKKAFNLIEKLKAKYYITGYIRYEAFTAEFSKFPLLYFEVFDKFQNYTPQKRQNLYIECKPVISFEEYASALKKIKNEISEGNTYEVNYTYDYEINFQENDFELFEFLLNTQKTPYNFYIKNDYDTVLSFSPELFFTLQNNHIVTKPMKGTIKRGNSKQEDELLKNFLHNDEKNRAENVMIVDLLRNDLGRIAKTGSVKVTKLFEIETHKTLHQMTSQIEADLNSDTTLYDIFKAIFPCGSITGAPKISTMKIIEKVEKGARNIYCGAIGLISPEKMIFSVPIRILQKQSNKKNFYCRVGGAIVWDSDIQEEWEETVTKTKFLNTDFQIIETIKIENGRLLFEKEHFTRMEKCAKYFGFQFKKPAISVEQDGILRLLLKRNGEICQEYKPIINNITNKITISPIKTDSSNEFLYYKTTYRPWFYEAMKKIAAGKIYDEVFFNKKGELTEGARSNIILQINGELYTPPEECGLLKGIYLKSMKNVHEKILYKSDLENAEKIFCVNSVRGMVEVKL